MYWLLISIIGMYLIYKNISINKNIEYNSYYSKKLYNKKISNNSKPYKLKYVCSINKHLQRRFKYI